MSLAKDTYRDQCRNCGKTVHIHTASGTDDANKSKWVRCAECRTINRCKRVDE